MLNPDLAPALPFLRKTAMQLSSKMRFVSAQLLALLTDDLWRHNAEHANAMAQRLAAAVTAIPGIALTQPVQANAVFATMPHHAIERAQTAYRFYVWDHTRDEVRWMCAWDTTAADVDAFVDALRSAVSA